MANKKKFDLSARGRSAFGGEERTAKFGEDIIEFAKKIPNPQFNRGPMTLPLITQLVKAGTSVGANYSSPC